MSDALRPGNPHVGNTAHYTAQCWVRFGYPEAEHFDTLRGRNLHRLLGSILWPFGERATPILTRLPEWLHLRHHGFEARLAALKPTAVLEIGAGLSPRGLAWTRAHPTLPYIELDLPDVVAAKREALAGVSLPPNYHLEVGDLLAERLALPVPLPEGGGSVAITEGVIPYLSPREKQAAFRNIARALQESGGGSYLLEVYPEDFFRRFPRGRAIAGKAMGWFVGRRFDERLCKDLDQAMGWLREAGFTEVERVDLMAIAPEGLELPERFQPFQVLEARI
ncbi:MAG: class I SAM-dependent methyltransferase [Alphaproteobacteria bacterium]|nr:class I SAM-dependent methyltransferase [Alphaproteobacteria bacterium]